MALTRAGVVPENQVKLELAAKIRVHAENGERARKVFESFATKRIVVSQDAVVALVITVDEDAQEAKADQNAMLEVFGKRIENGIAREIVW